MITGGTGSFGNIVLKGFFRTRKLIHYVKMTSFGMK